MTTLVIRYCRECSYEEEPIDGVYAAPAGCPYCKARIWWVRYEAGIEDEEARRVIVQNRADRTSFHERAAIEKRGEEIAYEVAEAIYLVSPWIGTRVGEYISFARLPPTSKQQYLAQAKAAIVAIGKLLQDTHSNDK